MDDTTLEDRHADKIWLSEWRERGCEDGNGGLRMSGAVEEGEPAKKAVQILLEKCSQGRRRIRKVWDQKVKGWA